MLDYCCGELRTYCLHFLRKYSNRSEKHRSGFMREARVRPPVRRRGLCGLPFFRDNASPADPLGSFPMYLTGWGAELYKQPTNINRFGNVLMSIRNKDRTLYLLWSKSEDFKLRELPQENVNFTSRN